MHTRMIHWQALLCLMAIVAILRQSNDAILGRYSKNNTLRIRRFLWYDNQSDPDYNDGDSIHVKQIVIGPPGTPPPITPPPSRKPTPNPTRSPTKRPTPHPTALPSIDASIAPSVHTHATQPPFISTLVPSVSPSPLQTTSRNPTGVSVPTTSHPSIDGQLSPIGVEGSTLSPSESSPSPNIVQPSDDGAFPSLPANVISQSLYSFSLTLAVTTSSISILPVKQLSTAVNDHMDSYFDEEMDEDWGFISTTIRSSGWENQRRTLRSQRKASSISFVTVNFYGEVNFEANHSIPSKSVVGVFQQAAFLGSNNKKFLDSLTTSSNIFLRQIVQVESRVSSGDNNDDDNLDDMESGNSNTSDSNDTNNILLLTFLIVCVAILGGAFFLTYKRRRRLLIEKKRRRVMDLGRVNDPPPDVFPHSDVYSRPNEETLPIYTASHSLEANDELKKVRSSSGKGMGYYLRRSTGSFDSSNPQLAPLPEYPHYQPSPSFIPRQAALDQYEMRTVDGRGLSDNLKFQPLVVNGDNVYYGPVDADMYVKLPQSFSVKDRSASNEDDDHHTVRSMDTQTKNQVDNVLNKLENVVQAKLQRINSSSGSQPPSRRNSHDTPLNNSSPPRSQPSSRRNSIDIPNFAPSPSTSRHASRQNVRDITPTPPLPPNRANSPSVLHDIYDSTTLIPVEPRPLHRAESSLSIEDVNQSDRDNARKSRTRSMSPITILRNRLSRSRSSSPAPHHRMTESNFQMPDDVSLSLSMADINSSGGGARGEVRKHSKHNRKRSTSDDVILRGLELPETQAGKVSPVMIHIEDYASNSENDLLLNNTASSSGRYRARSMSPAPQSRTRFMQQTQLTNNASRPLLPPLAPTYTPETVVPLPSMKQSNHPLSRTNSLGSSSNISIDVVTDDNSSKGNIDDSITESNSVLSKVLAEDVHKAVKMSVPSLGNFDDSQKATQNLSQALIPNQQVPNKESSKVSAPPSPHLPPRPNSAPVESEEKTNQQPFDNYEPGPNFQRKHSWSSIDGSLGQQQLVLPSTEDDRSVASVVESIDIPPSEDDGLFEPPSPMAEIDLVRSESNGSLGSVSSDEEQ